MYPLLVLLPKVWLKKREKYKREILVLDHQPSLAAQALLLKQEGKYLVEKIAL